MFLLDRLFTRRELSALDDEMPRFLDVVRPPSKVAGNVPPIPTNLVKAAAGGEEMPLNGRNDGGEERP